MSLKHILTQPQLTQRQLQTLEDVQEIETEIEYYLGVKDVIQDALSSCPDYKEPRLGLPRLPKTLDIELCELIVQDAEDLLR